MKATPFELVFGQPPRSTVFPGVSGLVMEEDVEDILTEEGRYPMCIGKVYDQCCKPLASYTGILHFHALCSLVYHRW